jgi:signal transduction histidine kinase
MAGSAQRPMRRTAAIGYRRTVNWLERQIERLRSLDATLVDAVLALLFTVLGLVTVFAHEIKNGLTEPTGLAVVTTTVVCLPVAFRRRAPLAAVAFACAAIIVHIALDFPEGSLPLTVLALAYTVAAWSSSRTAVAGLVTIYATITLLALMEAPGLDTATVLGNLAFYGVAWAIGIAVRARREAVEARIREADERSNVERQRAARLLAEERLRIARELHDVVAHSMSVIAVQAGVGAHVVEERPAEARVALEAISATSRAALAEMRQLLGALRDDDGERSRQPAPDLSNVAQLVDDVRAAGVPVVLEVSGACSGINPAIELSAYRLVQEALTNVIKHAGTPTRVVVTVQHDDESLTVSVVDDGRGAGASADADGPDSGHGLIGMRERVEIWGGRLTAGPASGGGYAVTATLPYGGLE